MAYDKKKLLNQSIDIIKEKNLYFVEDVVTLLPCVKSTFYDLFPLDSNEMNDIKKELDKNKVNTKIEIRQKLSMSDKTSDMIALYKLIGTSDERKSLSSSYIETGNDQKKPVNIPIITWVDDEPYDPLRIEDENSN